MISNNLFKNILTKVNLFALLNDEIMENNYGKTD